jgi:indolepyruvate ferredoxin oxidoreductase, beta subunit
MNYQIVCAGIGGRGVLLASTILIETAIHSGYHALASDEYGMSQRGGSVVSLIKIGDFKSPLVGRESADVLLAFEESEFYRNLPFLKRGGIAVINSSSGPLPETTRNLLAERNVRYFLVDADGIATDAHTVQASNMALLGFFSHLSIGPYTFRNVRDGVERKAKGRFAEKNIAVFDIGYERAKGREL